MGWNVCEEECPNCKSDDCLVWDRSGECRMITCTNCGFYLQARVTFMVDSSFIIEELKSQDLDGVNIGDYLFLKEDLEKRNQNIIQKDSEL